MSVKFLEWRSISRLLHPKAPRNLSYTATADSVTVKWDAVEGATSYNVYRGAAKTFDKSVTQPPYTADGLSADTQLTINVTAVGPGGESPMSEIVTKTKAAAQ